MQIFGMFLCGPEKDIWKFITKSIRNISIISLNCYFLQAVLFHQFEIFWEALKFEYKLHAKTFIQIDFYFNKVLKLIGSGTENFKFIIHQEITCSKYFIVCFNGGLMLITITNIISYNLDSIFMLIYLLFSVLTNWNFYSIISC